MKKIFSIIIFTMFIFTFSYFANNIYKASISYETAYQEYAKTKTLEKNLQNGTKELINNLFETLLNVKVQKQINNSANEMENINKLNIYITNNLRYLTILIIISLFTYLILSKTIFLIYLHIISFASLILGLISPIFLMYITKNIAGSLVILQFESSTIISSIEKLFLQDNYFVGGIILIFSIIFPIIKTLISFITIFIKKIKTLNFLDNIASKIGKFSMTDVFVLSIFLVYLSPKANGIIKTQVESGFYFFFIYVIISIAITLLKEEKIQN